MGKRIFSCLPSNPVCSRHAQAFCLSPPLSLSLFFFSPGEVEKAFCCRHCTKRGTILFFFSPHFLFLIYAHGEDLATTFFHVQHILGTGARKRLTRMTDGTLDGGSIFLEAAVMFACGRILAKVRTRLHFLWLLLDFSSPFPGANGSYVMRR